MVASFTDMRRLSPTAALALLLAATSASAQREMENLDRGLVAVRQLDGKVFTSWRLLGTDPEGIAFNLYRIAGGEEQRVNAAPLKGPTIEIDAQAGGATAYQVRPVRDGREGAPSRPARVLAEAYIEIPIQPIDGYRPGDASAGDLDGDGEYEIVVHQVRDGRDNSFAGITGTPVLDAYKLDGTHLWRIDLGINIREGEHYTQFIVYDLDGDGRAEIACKTADGTKDGRGKILGDPRKDWRNREEGTLKHGRILEGPEFLTVFDGRTGAALKTVDFIPGRDPIDGWGGIGGNGGNDSYGNRCDRFLAGVAYLDGKRPSLIMARGVYGRSVIAAWDWRDGSLKSRWVFDSGIGKPPYNRASPFSGMGGHALSVADVDGDGRDEIVYQAMTIDDNGKGLYTTGRRHGDALHVGDFDPARPGAELYLVSENEDETVRFRTPGAGLHDAKTGKLLWSHSPGVDISDGVVADIDPRHPGAEVWGGRGPLRTIRGEEIGAQPRIADWVVWWDGDLLREIYGGYAVFKWDAGAGREQRIFGVEPPYPAGRGSRHAGMRPNLAADLLGDWREELLLPGPGGKSLRLHFTTLPTEHRLTTLMHDPQYRLSIAWQNVAYNKPPHPSFFLGHGMKPPARPSIRAVGALPVEVGAAK
jgi:rhamnogalacturonan endolyase